MGFQDRVYRPEYRPERIGFAPEWSGVAILIAVNVAVWLANFVVSGNLLREILPLQVSLNDLGALRSDLPSHLLTGFWRLVSYGFLHDGPSLEHPGPFSPWHLLFNMLTLWFFGREVEAVMGRREFLRFYLAAIVVAGLAWVASCSLAAPHGTMRLVGASGGVMAVLAVYIWHFPHQTVLLWGVLPVPVWALGVLYLVLDVRGAAEAGDHVAHTAHLAGAAFGLLYAWRGWRLDGLEDRLRDLVRPRRRLRVVRDDEPDGRTSARSAARRRPEPDDDLDEQVDRILAKISRSGEASLTTAERETLTRASRRLKERSR